MPINLVCSATKSSMEVAMAIAAGQLAAVQLAAVQQIWKYEKKVSSKLQSMVEGLTDSSKGSSQITEQDTV